MLCKTSKKIISGCDRHCYTHHHYPNKGQKKEHSTTGIDTGAQTHWPPSARVVYADGPLHLKFQIIKFARVIFSFTTVSAMQLSDVTCV